MCIRDSSRKSKLLDAYLDGILNKQEYQKKAEELDAVSYTHLMIRMLKSILQRMSR